MSGTIEPVDSSDMDPRLTPEDLGGDPVSAFQRSRDLAAGHNVAAADAMALASVSAEGFECRNWTQGVYSVA
jgi:hypothetical protein